MRFLLYLYSRNTLILTLLIIFTFVFLIPFPVNVIDQIENENSNYIEIGFKKISLKQLDPFQCEVRENHLVCKNIDGSNHTIE